MDRDSERLHPGAQRTRRVFGVYSAIREPAAPGRGKAGAVQEKEPIREGGSLVVWLRNRF